MGLDLTHNAAHILPTHEVTAVLAVFNEAAVPAGNAAQIIADVRIADKGSFSINNELVISAQLCFDTYLVKYDGKEVTLTEKGCEKEATVNLAIGEKKYDNVTKDDIETEFNISDDISDMTNIVCNNGATISMNDNTLKLLLPIVLANSS